MTRFTVYDTLFSESAIYYVDPISGKTKNISCNPDSVESFKSVITKKLIRELASHLYFNRSKVYDFLVKSNPHHITPAFRRAITRLRVNVSNMYMHEDINDLSTHISFQIIPDLFSANVAPSKTKPEAERYFFLANELENLTHEILNSGIHKPDAEMSTEKKAQISL